MPAFVVPTTFTASDRYSPTVMSMSRTTERFARNAQRFASDTSRLFTRPKNAVDGMLNSMTGGSFNARMIGVFGAGGLIATGLKYIIDAAGEAEAATYSFVPSTGSLENAKALTQDLYKEAEKTSFSFMGLAQPTKMLLSMGAATKESVIPTLRMLGDLAQGDAVKLERIAYQYGQVSAKGKLKSDDLKDLASHVPMMPILSKFYGKSNAWVQKEIKSGGVSFNELAAAFQKATSAGGIFFEMATQRMNSLPGQVERSSEYLQGAARELGDAMLPAVKHLVERFGQVVVRTREWATANKELVAQQADKWFDRIGNSVIWLYNNFELITTAAKWYIGALVGLKVISMAIATYQYAAATATFFWSAQMGIAAFMSGNLTRGIVANSIAFGAYTTSARIASVATTAFGWAAKLSMGEVTALIGVFTALAGAIAYVIYQENKFNDNLEKRNRDMSGRGFDEGKSALIKNYETYQKGGMSKEEALKKASLDVEKMAQSKKAEAYYMEHDAKTDYEKKLAKYKMDYATGLENAAQSSREVVSGQEKRKKRESIELIRSQSQMNEFQKVISHQKFSLQIQNDTNNTIKPKGVPKGLDVRIDSTKNYSGLDR